jgi:hypothetical protein
MLVTLTTDEIDLLDRQNSDTRSRGGYQALLVQLQEGLDSALELYYFRLDIWTELGDMPSTTAREVGRIGCCLYSPDP